MIKYEMVKLMKVVITSDAHGNIRLLKKIAEINNDADLFIDAGDSERCEEDILPFKSVRGNWDYLIKNPFRVDTLEGVTLYTTHGSGFLFNLNHLVKMASEFNANVAIFGHTHMPLVQLIDGVLVINPGSVSIPRRCAPSYAIVTFTNTHDIKAEIKEIKF